MAVTILNNKDSKTKKYLAKIGEVIVYMNYLEFMLEFHIQDLIKPVGDMDEVQRVSARIIYPLSFNKKIELLSSLIMERCGQKEFRKFQELEKLLERCGQIRNGIVHSLWYIQYGNKERGIYSKTLRIHMREAVKRKKPFKFSEAVKYVKISELEEFVTEISSVIEKLMIFFAPVEDKSRL